MTPYPTTTAFFGTPVNIIDHAGQRWLTAEQAGLCLGYGEANARQGIINLYNRHVDEFDPGDAAKINLISTDGKRYDMLCFSASGCQLLGFFANTARAKQFRAWAKTVLATGGATPAAAGATGRPPVITRAVEFAALSLFADGLSQKDVAARLHISKATVNTMIHGRFRFSPLAGEDQTTPALRAAVVARLMNNERERLVRKYCTSAANVGLAQALDSGALALLGSAPATTDITLHLTVDPAHSAKEAA